MRAISARFAPLPPRRFLIDASPSVFAPNRYMNFRLPALGADFAAAFFGAVFLATFFAICFSYFIVVLHMRAETGRYRRESGCTKQAAETGKKSGKLKPDGFPGARGPEIAPIWEPILRERGCEIIEDGGKQILRDIFGYYFRRVKKLHGVRTETAGIFLLNS